MKRRFGLASACVMASLLAGCGLGTPKAPFVPTAVPADFAIIVDENVDTYYARQHVQQVITASDAMSRTSYKSRRDFNNTLVSSFAQEHGLTPEQLQSMWNEVAKNQLLAGGKIWVNWLSEADLYRLQQNTVQIRANGQVRTYRTSNGYVPAMRDLMLLVEAVKLPIGQRGAPVVTQPSAPPPTMPPAAVEEALKPTTASRPAE